MDHIINVDDSPKMSGFFKIWAVDPISGAKRLLVDKNNLILYAGADLLAQSLAGVDNTNISHIYVGYQNTNGNVTPTVIDKAYSVPFSNYGTGNYASYGYLRLPLAYSPSFSADANYSTNIVLFTTVIATTANAIPAGSFNTSTNSTPSKIFEIALVSGLNPINSSQDKVFSRANFNALTYDSNFNLTITWGIRFSA